MVIFGTTVLVPYHYRRTTVGNVKTRYRYTMMTSSTFSALLAICAGNSPVTGELPAQRPATRSFDVFFDLRLNKSLSKQPWGWWFETPSRPLWRHRNGKSINCSDLTKGWVTSLAVQVTTTKIVSVIAALFQGLLFGISGGVSKHLWAFRSKSS